MRRVLIVSIAAGNDFHHSYRIAGEKRNQI